MTTRVATRDVETEGNKVSSSFHLTDKSTAVRCWRETVEASGIDDKVLASDAGFSKGHYSKIASGEQGDLLGLVYRVGRKHPALRHDFIARLAEAEGADAVESAAEQLVFAAIRFLRLRGADVFPPRATQMAKADLAHIAKAVSQ